MAKYNYVALDARGKETKGTLEVTSQNEAIGRVKEMGLFPTRITEADRVSGKPSAKKAKVGGKKGGGMNMNLNIKIPFLTGRVKPKVLTTFTRQLATLVDAGLPLLRGLRVLEKQERNRTLKEILGELALAIEGGSTFSEALAQHPKVFNRLFVNMVKAGELGGVLEVVLKRLAEFSEKAQKIRGKIKAALFYPIAVLIVATCILTLLLTFVIPRFKDVFKGMGVEMPWFTMAGDGGQRRRAAAHSDHARVRGGRVGAVCSGHQDQDGPVVVGQIQAQGAGLWAGRQQSGHFPFHPHPRHPGQQRRADFAGADHCQRNRRQRGRQQRREQGA